MACSAVATRSDAITEGSINPIGTYLLLEEETFGMMRYVSSCTLSQKNLIGVAAAFWVGAGGFFAAIFPLELGPTPSLTSLTA